ncbi:MAG: hypothetical protein ACKVU4_10190 [Phycisphaerales bacterium]
MTTIRAWMVAAVSAATGACSAAAGQTIVPGGPVSGTWDAAGSPYVVQGDLLVGDLLIKEGVEVLVDGPYSIEVLVRLRVLGTPTQRVTITSNNPVSWWKGIGFTDTGPGSEFRHCTLARSENSAVRIGGPSVSPPTFFRCSILDNRATGVMSEAGAGAGIHAVVPPGQMLIMDSCRIADNAVDPGVNAWGNYKGGGVYVHGAAEITGCVFEHNEVYAYGNCPGCGVTARGSAVFAEGDGEVALNVCTIVNGRAHAENGVDRDSRGAVYFAGTGVLRLTNCIVGCNETTGWNPQASGVWVESGEAEIVNTTIARNASEGLSNNGALVNVRNSILYFNASGGPQFVGTVAFEHSNVQGGIQPGPGNISNNPAFKGIGCDACQLGIISASPSVDAGDPDPGYNDACSPPSHGTVRNDMGAYGGPEGCGWPYPSWCYADCNDSCTLTVADFGCFQGKYVLGDLFADCNQSGTLTVADFGCFQGKYVLGCP